jgi:tRNA dimethylallyltransferase
MFKKALVIIGPTASGKSDLAIELAQKHGGEIISVDSRQVYRGLDIGTGKVTQVEQALVPHHLLDICEPGASYNVTDFLRDAQKIEADIRARGKLPIFCGGTLFWMESYLNQTVFPEVPPNKALRKELEEKTTEELFALLKEKDIERAKTVDPQNKIRLIRALEIIESLGNVPALATQKNWQDEYELIILEPEREALRERIQKRLTTRFEAGMIEEVKTLITKGAAHEWLENLGLEYKYISLSLRGELTEEEMKEKLFFAIWHYAKRQITFLKRFTRA